MTNNNPFKAIKQWASIQKGRGLQEPPKPGDIYLSTQKKEHSPAVEANTPRRSYRIWTIISEQSGADLERIMIRIREETGKKPKQAEALEQAIRALKDQYRM